MKKDARFVICITVILMLVLLCLFTCSAEKEDEEKNQQQVPVEVIPVPTKIISLPSNDGKEDSDAGIKLKRIEFYTITGAAGTRIDTAETLVMESIEVTPKLIVDYCLDAFSDEEIELEVIHIKNEEGLCTIDFNDSIFAAEEMGRVTETLILDALAMSVLDNCENVEKVTFTINGKAYKTSNRSLGEDETYMSK